MFGPKIKKLGREVFCCYDNSSNDITGAPPSFFPHSCTAGQSQGSSCNISEWIAFLSLCVTAHGVSSGEGHHTQRVGVVSTQAGVLLSSPGMWERWKDKHRWNARRLDTLYVCV